MLLTSVRFVNFKSLVDFNLPLAKLTCLIGLNGAGKSTVLQALDFAGQLFRDGLPGWLSERNWTAADLNSKLIGKSIIGVEIVAEDAEQQYLWMGRFNRSLLRCTAEQFFVSRKKMIDGELRLGSRTKTFAVTDGVIRTESAVAGEIAFKYTGSVLSALDPDKLPDESIRQFVNFVQHLDSLELLAPQALRRRTSQSLGRLGRGGERLSAFLYELPPAQRKELEAQLVKCYPRLEHLFARSLRGGWKELSIREQFGNRRLSTEATHINDGMLRLMAILAETLTDATLLMFDEIENGINPELVEYLLNTLLEAPQQVLVTTHSPMILNFLDDETARAGVQYLWRDEATGGTRAIPFFSIPSLNEKLKVMGPGEAFVDTDLTRLAGEIATLTPAEAD